MNVESMRTKMNAKEHLNVEIQMECKNSFSERIKATLADSEGRCSFLHTELILGLGSFLLPYILGFIVITVLCLSMVDISLNTYFTILTESFSVTGLWTIGYFFLSILFFIYIVATYLIKR
jgi:hypothetical protein